MDAQRLKIELLAEAGRLLLGHSESTGATRRTLADTARAISDERCDVVVSYGAIAVSLGGDVPRIKEFRQVHPNTALLARVHSILDRVRRADLDTASALALLERSEVDTPRHSRWVAVLMIALAAAGLAGVLGAGVGAALVAGFAAGLGLLVRQEISRRVDSLFLPPLAASFLGAIFGGLAFRLGWLRTPELALIVPALMLVPGPHLINGVLDLVENYIPMSLARLGLASGILIANALGVVAGVELILPDGLPPGVKGDAEHIGLVADLILAAIVTCGFAVVFNSPWKQVGMAALVGMIGHGCRYLGLEAGFRLEGATFLGGIAVGAVAGWIARSGKTPFAVIAFAGAVPMMPGLLLYQALGGALRFARHSDNGTTETVAAILLSATQSCLVIAGLTLGLVLGAFLVPAVKEPTSPRESSDRGENAEPRDR